MKIEDITIVQEKDKLFIIHYKDWYAYYKDMYGYTHYLQKNSTWANNCEHGWFANKTQLMRALKIALKTQTMVEVNEAVLSKIKSLVSQLNKLLKEIK